MEVNVDSIRNSEWVERYRPCKIEDIILPERIKTIFKNLLTKKEIPNLLLTGGAGSGKTTLAKVFAKEMGANIRFINASMERGIDVLRTQIENFVSTVSLNSSVEKVVILDEIDNMSTTAILALRGFIENYSPNARFFLTCNYPSKLPDPIRSRMQVVEFEWSQEEKKALIKEFGKRLLFIFDKEKVIIEEGGKKALSEFVRKKFPDMRAILNEIQLFARIDGKINEGLLYLLDENKYNALYKMMKEMNFTECRKWVSDNISNQVEHFYQKLFQDIDIIFEPKSLPDAVIILDRQEFQSSNMFNKQLNIMACITYLMAECKFK